MPDQSAGAANRTYGFPAAFPRGKSIGRGRGNARGNQRRGQTGVCRERPPVADWLLAFPELGQGLRFSGEKRQAVQPPSMHTTTMECCMTPQIQAKCVRTHCIRWLGRTCGISGHKSVLHPPGRRSRGGERERRADQSLHCMALSGLSRDAPRPHRGPPSRRGATRRRFRGGRSRP